MYLALRVLLQGDDIPPAGSSSEHDSGLQAQLRVRLHPFQMSSFSADVTSRVVVCSLIQSTARPTPSDPSTRERRNPSDREGAQGGHHHRHHRDHHHSGRERSSGGHRRTAGEAGEANGERKDF